MLFIAAAVVSVSAQEGPAHFLMEIQNRISELNKADNSKESLLEMLQVLEESLDMDYIAGFVLKRHIDALSEEQIAKFRSLFKEYISWTFVFYFKNYIVRKGVDFQIGQVKALKKDQGYVIRSTAIISETQSVILDWKVKQEDSGNYKIVNLAIEGGMGFLKNMRNEFSSFIRAKGFDELLNILEQKSRGLEESNKNMQSEFSSIETYGINFRPLFTKRGGMNFLNY